MDEKERERKETIDNLIGHLKSTIYILGEVVDELRDEERRSSNLEEAKRHLVKGLEALRRRTK